MANFDLVYVVKKKRELLSHIFGKTFATHLVFVVVRFHKST